MSQGAGGGTGGGGGMGSMLKGLGDQDLTLGQGKETGLKHSAELKILNALIGNTPPGVQVTSGQTPGPAQVSPWMPFLVQSLLQSFRG